MKNGDTQEFTPFTDLERVFCEETRAWVGERWVGGRDGWVSTTIAGKNVTRDTRFCSGKRDGNPRTAP